MKKFKKIFLLDNFDSFTFNLVDYFRQLGCEVFVYRNNVQLEKIEEIDPDLIVFSPGPSVPKNAGNMMQIIDRYHQKYPMFGVCLGHEAFIEYFGGNLKFVKPVHGRNSKIKHDGRSIFSVLEQNFLAGRYHSLCADKVPECFEISAEADGLVMAIRHKNLQIEGVQFHPESVLTMKSGNGLKMIENVVKKRFGINEIEKFLLETIEGKTGLDEQIKFLEKYNPEKISPEELRIFVNFLLGKMKKTLQMPDAIDICGTGGSGLNRINTSTISAIILASLGVGVAKHGNKAASGRFGSFDLLEALGIEFENDDLEKKYGQENLAFIYARKFHPAVKAFIQAREKIGKPTIFNLLGPLLNPANVKRQIIGMPYKNQMRLMAETCKLLGKKNILVVSGEDGLDEVTLTAKTKVVELRNGEIFDYEISPEDFGIKKCDITEITSADNISCVEIAEKILEGNCETRHADLVYINAALGLKLAGLVDTLKDGYVMAKNANGLQKLQSYKGNILREIAATKILKKAEGSFYDAISKGNLSLIAEIKKVSPSRGIIYKGDFNPEEIAKIYEDAGASAISVLTDEKYFGGSFEDLRKVREVTKLPLLCKDFIISEYQVSKARDFGADAVLLIAGLLNLEELNSLLKIARQLGMEALVEAHDEMELKKVLQSEARIIGINNRNLKDFSIDLETTNKLIELIPENKLVVSESGINSIVDIGKIHSRVNAILVGTAIMSSTNIKEKINEITQAISYK